VFLLSIDQASPQVFTSPISHKLLSSNAVNLLLSTEGIESYRINVSGISYQST